MRSAKRFSTILILRALDGPTQIVTATVIHSSKKPLVRSISILVEPVLGVV